MLYIFCMLAAPAFSNSSAAGIALISAIEVQPTAFITAMPASSASFSVGTLS